ncbi:MAG TPA: hypothetical protein ENO11_06290, partial [Desulfobacteraceae bacterium]|nr:hypothetical protein [Desulfobacteraceae bacterium]
MSIASALTVDIPREYPDISSFEEFSDPPFTQQDVKKQHDEEMNKVRVEILDGRRHFVGDEPLTIEYLVMFPFGARMLRESVTRDIAPFEVISLQIGRRASALAGKNLEAVPISLTIRLPKEFAIDVYTLPAISVRLSFEHFAVAGQKKEEIEVTSESVQLHKVPLYVDVVQRNDRGTIGDALPFRIEVHAGKGSGILNEYPPETPVKGIIYLSEYSPEPPVVLLERRRSGFVAESYRIISWDYVIALHDLNEEGAIVELPPVIWTRQLEEKTASNEDAGTESVGRSRNTVIDNLSAEAGENLKIIQPDPITIRSYGIISTDSSFNPLKDPPGRTDSEEFLLYTLPLFIFLAGLVLTLLWLVSSLVQFLHRARQRHP